MPAKAETIDAYLAPLPADKRAALEHIRQTIQAAVPEAVECIAYQLPAFRLGKRKLVAFGAAAKHCALYPMSSATIGRFSAELQGYDTSKGTIRFTPDKPLPDALLRQIIQARIEENLALDHQAGRKH